MNVFDTSGKLLHRLEHGPWMNAPWGITVAPPDFGRFCNALLVGMFGDGSIAAFDAGDRHFLGQLNAADGSALAQGKGLWGIAFGNGSGSGPTNTLYFATDMARTNGFHGLFGAIDFVPPPPPPPPHHHHPHNGDGQRGD